MPVCIDWNQSLNLNRSVSAIFDFRRIFLRFYLITERQSSSRTRAVEGDAQILQISMMHFLLRHTQERCEEPGSPPLAV